MSLKKNIMKIRLLFILLLFSSLSYSLVAQCNFKTLGHRGGSSYNFPENTLTALEQGFLENIYAAEVDVRYTSDSVLVLMHDYRIDRTTNGIGEISAMSYSEVQKLNAGSWKSAQFAGERVPTLAEAMQLAFNYKKKLYLNMKIYNPYLIAKVLKATSLPDTLVILDPDDLDKVKEYHAIMPKVPLAYFGDIPTDINDNSFYTLLKENGVIAVEVPADLIVAKKDMLQLYKAKLHSYNIEFWTYTVNENKFMNMLKDFGIDGLETDRPTEAGAIFCGNAKGGYYPRKQITGQWDFNNSLAGTIGSQLVLMSNTNANPPSVTFGKTSSYSMPLIDGKDITVAKIPAFSADYSLRFFSNIFPDGPPSVQDCDNTYTLIFDLLKPKSTADYISIYQTSNNNSDDGDMFIYSSNNSIGIAGDYHGIIKDNTWFRLALVFDLEKEKIDKYIDGKLIGTNAVTNGLNARFCINNNWGVQSSNFFSDNDGETSDMYVSSIQLRNYSMTADEIAYLGGVSASKISDTIFNSLAKRPKFSAQPKDTTIFIDASVVLKADASDTVNYRWQMNTGKGWEYVKGEHFNGVASKALSLTKMGSEWNGTKFRCLAYSELASISKEITLSIKTDNTSIATELMSKISIYPNPSAGTISIKFDAHNKVISLAIFNLQGNKVFEKQDIVSEQELNFNLPNNTYLFQVMTEKGVLYKKILFQK